jgi:hypothetical protein
LRHPPRRIFKRRPAVWGTEWGRFSELAACRRILQKRHPLD